MSEWKSVESKQMTKITIENENGIYSAAVQQELMSIDEIMAELIIPVLMAAGYSDELIRSAFENQGVI